jgi:hypothetical protein
MQLVRAQRPVVFVGPSLPRAEVERLLPDCIVRPPIQRGDLHDRPVPAGAVFVILDGVATGRQAITGREILDVLGNHAQVVGACGMGARRAAECWPGGMLGIGIVYRMFRNGTGSNDDEVVVSLRPGPGAGTSVSLVNVRYATSKLRRRGTIDQNMRDRIVSAAEGLPVDERRWDLILASAGVDEAAEELALVLGAIDVQAEDARRALHHVAAQGRLAPVPSSFAATVTRLSQESKMPSPPTSPPPIDVKQELLRWLFISGRFHRYLRGVRETVPRPPAAGEKHMTTAALQRFFAELDIFDETDGDEWLARMGLHPAPVDGPRTAEAARSDLRLVASALLGHGPTGQELWTELVARGNLELELGILRTIRAAAQQARGQGLRADRAHRLEAERTIALDHLFADWHELETHAEHDGSLWWRLCAYRDELALACAARDRCFEPGLTC